jgi:hypothetical protein
MPFNNHIITTKFKEEINKMTFVEMRSKMLEHFAEMTKDSTELFEVSLDNDKLWDLYLESFPPDKNKIFRERREHDCSCCRHFIKSMGNVVTIKNNKIISLWDFDIEGDDTYEPSIKAMREYVHECAIRDVFYTKEKRIGTEYNRELVGDKLHTWEHFYADIPKRFVLSGSTSKSEKQGQFRDTRNVFKRSLDEITEEAVSVVLELIAQGSLYRGEEHKGVLEKFAEYQTKYNQLTDEQKEIFAWEYASEAGMAIGRIRNHSIGTLLTDISDGIDLDRAVKSYEAIVAPANYKRPKAIFTKRMLEDAKKTISDLGYMDSLKRRYATLDDITVNNILFANRDSAKRISVADIFDEMATSVAVNPKKFNKVEEINIENFINNVLPTAQEIEVLFENRLASNMVSLIAPENKDSKTMFKWNNNFCWAYTGNVTDSMKERVKAAGGSVTGDLRFSIQWNEDGNDNCDLDAHCITPLSGDEIYYGHKQSVTHGELDVDIIHPDGKVAVENITWANRNNMKDGVYRFYVHQFSGSARNGFRAEIEFDGQIYSFDYSHPMRRKEKVAVAEVTLKNGQFTIKPLLSKKNISSREVWGINTNQFIPVSVVMYSPNYWDEQNGIGNKHYFFMLKGCVNTETPNGFYNEFLNNELDKHKRVMEALGSKLAVTDADDQLSGIGFSSTKRNSIIVKVKGKTERTLKINF